MRRGASDRTARRGPRATGKTSDRPSARIPAGIMPAPGYRPAGGTSSVRTCRSVLVAEPDPGGAGGSAAIAAPNKGRRFTAIVLLHRGRRERDAVADDALVEQPGAGRNDLEIGR